MTIKIKKIKKRIVNPPFQKQKDEVIYHRLFSIFGFTRICNRYTDEINAN